ncbi:MAG: protein kinase [Planctomycetota bacterium]
MPDLTRSSETDGVDESMPKEIAGYRILRRIGEGGMGVVFAARQPSIHREIALKVLRVALGSSAARRRFEYESGLLGRLRHPSIAQIYEAGSFLGPSGEAVPFFAMELVQDGDSITDFATREALGPHEKIELFLEVLDGVHHAHHAHQRGIVHRDLKPQNLLVGADSLPKVIDFGVAREVQVDSGTSTIRTKTGQLLGTPQYMSPEQCSGGEKEIDLRTDVYSLGVVLFELLTSTLPCGLSSVSNFEFAKVIRERRPERVSSLSGLQSRDLDTVVHKALEKDPERRYGSVAAFADDLRRYLAHEPIAARPPSSIYQMAMFARRNRGLVAGLTLVSVLVLATAVIGTTLALRLSSVAEDERELRLRGLESASRLAARTVAIEMQLRWRILQSAADDPELRERLLVAPAAVDTDAWLQSWLEDRFRQYSGGTPAVSWFLNDRIGVQRARAPFNADTVGGNFAFRDYFHGLGRDYTPQEAQGLEPIDQVHRSLPFRSQATGNLVVAFSVPIFGGVDGRDVLGVLAMTVETGRFAVLELGLDDAQIASLVDTRLDSQGRPGLLLHHPGIARSRVEDPRTGIYVDPVQLEWLQESIELGLTGLRPYSVDRWTDPVGGNYERPWLAAFAPVLVEGVSDRERDTGWVVVVQELAAN